MANKVKFGLSEVHIAPITAVGDSSYTYGTIFSIPGAVSLTLDRAGDETEFYADNIKYFTQSAESKILILQVPARQPFTFPNILDLVLKGESEI